MCDVEIWTSVPRLQICELLGSLVLASAMVVWFTNDPTQERFTLAVTFCFFALVGTLALLANTTSTSIAPKRSIYQCFCLGIQAFLYEHGPRYHFFTGLGDLWDFVSALLGLASCAMYVVESYFPFLVAEVSWQSVEILLSCVFLTDYSSRVLLARDRFGYIFSLHGIINVISTLPVLSFHASSFWLYNTHGAEQIKQVNFVYLRMLRLTRSMRALQALRLVKVGSHMSLQREVFNLAFIVLVIVFSAAGFYQWLENDETCFDVSIRNTLNHESYSNDMSCTHFHLAFYWTTIETLGRPRLAMKKNTTILMLIALVGFSVVMIPKHMAAVLAILQRSNKYQRASYHPCRGRLHLVVAGHQEYASINMLLYEHFHPDRGTHSVQSVVLLFPTSPDKELELLLGNPCYSGRVTYIEGTPLQEVDLERAGLDTAAGVIFLANKDAPDAQWHDGELLTCIQSMKAYWLREVVQKQRHRHFNSSREASSLLRPRIVAQILLSESKDFLVELPGWTRHDAVVVHGEYMAWMLAMAALARGMATLVFNLMSHTDPQCYYATKWYPRYEHGASQDLYSVQVLVPDGLHLVGASLGGLAAEMSKFQCLLIAIDRGSELALFPGANDMRIQVSDRLFFIAQSLPVLESVLESVSGNNNISRRTKRQQKPHFSRWLSQTNLHQPYRQNVSISTRRSSPSRSSRKNACYDQIGPAVDLVSRASSRTSILSSLPRGCSDVDLVHMDDEAEGDLVSLQGIPAPHTATDIGFRKLLECRDPEWSGHIVLLGLPRIPGEKPSMRTFIVDIIEALQSARDAGIQECESVRVCVVDEDAPQRLAEVCNHEPKIARMVSRGIIRAVAQHVRNRGALIREAHLDKARAIIALPEHVTNALSRSLSTVQKKTSPAHTRTVKQIIDTNTVISMQVAAGCVARARHGRMTPAWSGISKSIHGVTLLLQEGTSNLFFGHANMRHAGSAVSNPRWADISPLNLSPLFASGELLAVTCFDRFAVEALFTPQVLPLMRMLIFGDNARRRLYQIECPEKYIGEPFEAVQKEMIPCGRMLLGLLRFPDGSGTFESGEVCEHPELADSSLPYVMTNPKPGTVILRSSDLFFIVGTKSDASEGVSLGHRDRDADVILPHHSDNEPLDGVLKF